MHRVKLYNADGSFSHKFINKDQCIRQANATHNPENKTYRVVTWDAIVKTMNDKGLFLKYQLKNMKKGQVIVCPSQIGKLSLSESLVSQDAGKI